MPLPSHGVTWDFVYNGAMPLYHRDGELRPHDWKPSSRLRLEKVEGASEGLHKTGSR